MNEFQGAFMKKFIISLIILLIFGATVFFIGWIQIYVPVDSQAVLISKTSGIKNEVIKAGDFTWCWERLLPTNTELRHFSLYPRNYKKTITGTLPSADVYTYMIEGEPNFSYNFSVDMTIQIKSEKLPELIKSTGLKNQSELENYISSQADTVARSVIQYVIEESIDDIDYVVQASLSDTELITAINAPSRFPYLEITSIKVNNVILPDIIMYNHAKNSYTVYQNAIQKYIDEAAVLQGAQYAKDYLEIDRLAKLGRVLADYPELVSFMAVTKGNFDYELPSEIPLISELVN